MIKKSIFDRIILGFTLMSIIVFSVLLIYSTNATKKGLIDEKKEVLTNEAFLIAEQTFSGYVQEIYTLEKMKSILDYYSDTLQASIWIADKHGIIIACSNPDNSSASQPASQPKNLYLLDENFDMAHKQTFQGDFFNMFQSEVITVAIPILTNGEPDGMILLHATVSQLSDVQNNIFSAVYIPFLTLLVVCIALLALISGKIIRPIKKMNSVAEQYAAGNLEQKMEINSRDEIGQLAQTLEYMASELSKLDDYRRDFISNISHDFRSPLTSIKGYIEAIKDGTIPPEMQDKYLNIVINETNRLTKLTSSMLELNKMDSYGIWLVLKEFDIIKLVKNAMATFEGKCIDKNISLILNNHCENNMVRGDKTKIQQVIYNLLDNAIKFTPSGKNIYITLNEKNDKLFVSVKDEGCGIAPDDLKKIWVRFYKADASRGKDKNGTGLGLSITKEIIKAHNENINVVSTEGVGSEFTFSLPQVPPTEKQP